MPGRRLELWGLGEIADWLSVSKRTVHYHVNRPGFPEPVARLQMGPVWNAQDIREWRNPRSKGTNDG